jgi:hypothetical protein
VRFAWEEFLTTDNTDSNPDLIRVIRGYGLWLLAFALTRITALLLLLLRLRLLLLLRLLRTFLFRLWLWVRPRCWRWSFRGSRWCCDTLASWLLLSHWLCGSFSLRCVLTFNLPLWLLDTTSFTLLLAATSRFLDTRLLLNWSRRWSLLRHLLLLRTSTASTFITHLELLSLRMIGRVVYVHPLREIRTEGGCYRSRARDDGGVVELLRDARRNVDLASTPRGVHHGIPQWCYH